MHPAVLGKMGLRCLEKPLSKTRVKDEKPQVSVRV